MAGALRVLAQRVAGSARGTVAQPQQYQHYRTAILTYISQTTPKAYFSTKTPTDRVSRALGNLYATDWTPSLFDGTIAEVKSVLAKGAEPGTEAKFAELENAFAAAEAVERFGERVQLLRQYVDDFTDGQKVPDDVKSATQDVLQRYNKYISSFDPEREKAIRKKVETNLGAAVLQLRQRIAGLGADWGKISVLCTSGMAGSYIESRV
eukprot:jgi/Chlat1/5626/Chrsp369S05384